VCLGISGSDETKYTANSNGLPTSTYDERDTQQFALFSQIIPQLAIESPEELENIMVQYPPMELDFKAMLENHEYRVVNDPELFQFIYKKTVLFAPFVRFCVLMLE